jgi:hypothetical protein
VWYLDGVKKLKRNPNLARRALASSSITLVSSSPADIEAKEPITFKINIIIDKLQGSTDPCSRFIKAGDPSPWHNLSEVPKQLRGWIGEPPAPPDTSEWQAEQEQMIRDAFGPVNESVEEELQRRQAQAITDSVALNEIARQKANRQDQFERDLQAEHDAKVAELYEAQPQKRKNP